MKKATLILIVVLALPLFAFSNAFAVSVTATILDDYIEVGETFDVEIWADSESFSWELTSFGFDVDDSADTVLSYAGYSLDFDYMDVSDPFTPSNVSGASLTYPTGNALLSTLSFTANEAGIGEFSLFGLYDGLFYGLFYFDPLADFFDPFADPFPGADIFLTQEITVNAVDTGTNPVPEPSTIILFSSGLIGLVWYRRKR